jgi:hypothetical protein
LQISILYTKLYNFGRLRTFYLTILSVLLVSLSASAQDSSGANATLPNYPGRKWFIGGLSATGYTGSLVLLNEVWYKDYPKSSFHTFNDANEWLLMDKLGHAWSTYNLARGLTSAWYWAGVPGNKGVLLGSGSAFSYVMIIELLDAHSSEWGWSWSDVGANTLGSALFAAQELGWKEQRLLYKYSGHVLPYKDLEARADELFGKSTAERLLKDYNGQTYWLSANPKSFLPDSRFPAWLNIAVGHGASGMLGGFENRGYGKDGRIIFDRTDITRSRQWYLSLDIDFSKIRTNSRALRTAFTILNTLKIPAPTLEMTKGRLKIHALYF